MLKCTANNNLHNNCPNSFIFVPVSFLHSLYSTVEFLFIFEIREEMKPKKKLVKETDLIAIIYFYTWQFFFWFHYNNKLWTCDNHTLCGNVAIRHHALGSFATRSLSLVHLYLHKYSAHFFFMWISTTNRGISTNKNMATKLPEANV